MELHSHGQQEVRLAKDAAHLGGPPPRTQFSVLRVSCQLSNMVVKEKIYSQHLTCREGSPSARMSHL